MRARRARHGVLVAAGLVLLGSGLALLLAPPRADAPDIEPAVGSPAGAAASTSAPPAPRGPADPPAPVAVALPATAQPVPVVPVGVLESGALELPERPSVLGWYAAGATPGDPAGTAVVAGHVDSARYGAGPLRTLAGLALGDVVTVTDASGGQHRYAVTSRTQLAKPALPRELFRTDGPPQLALVTCGGAFDRSTGSYGDNVVVLAAPTS